MSLVFVLKMPIEVGHCFDFNWCLNVPSMVRAEGAVSAGQHFSLNRKGGATSALDSQISDDQNTGLQVDQCIFSSGSGTVDCLMSKLIHLLKLCSMRSCERQTHGCDLYSGL